MNSRNSLVSGLGVADGIEVDAQLTSDGVLVAYHDEDLSALTACWGKINAHSWLELGTCPNTETDETYPIVRLDSFLLEVAKAYPDAEFTLDCKLFANGDWWSYVEAFGNAITRLEAHPDLDGRVLVECQVMDFLQFVNDRNKGIPVFLYATSADAAIDSAVSRSFTGITIHNDMVAVDQVATAKQRGLSVTLFGVGAFGQAAALAKQPDRLQTDAPSSFAR